MSSAELQNRDAGWPPINGASGSSGTMRAITLPRPAAGIVLMSTVPYVIA